MVGAIDVDPAKAPLFDKGAAKDLALKPCADFLTGEDFSACEDRSDREDFLARLLAASCGGVQIIEIDGSIGENGAIAAPSRGVGIFVSQGSWLAFWRHEDLGQACAALEAAASGGVGRMCAGRLDGAGGVRWWEVTLTPIRRGGGRIEKILAVSNDITDLHQTLERQRSLLAETPHRIKNILALVQAVAMQTFRSGGTVGKIKTLFSERLVALAQTQNLLNAGSASRVDLSELVRVELNGQHIDDPERVALDGPAILLGAKPALSFGLLISELVLHSRRFGALSVMNGRLDIGWRIVSTRENPRFFFVWTEYGASASAFFGGGALDQALIAALGATIEKTQNDESASVIIDAPLERIVS